MSFPWLEREALLLAPYAMHSADTAGRKHPEPPHPYRAPFQRDRDRIVHCSAFRRLSGKTQVFTGELGDYHRTRLTHTMEVASLARTLGRALRLNEDLVEALALLHDLGHPPFGHAGEDALNECLREHGGFNHNRHALTIVEELEQRYPKFAGLNLSQEVLEGQKARAERSTSPVLLEAQVVDAADSVAYDTHDSDDALELGLLRIEELLEMPIWAECHRRVRRHWTDLQGRELQKALVKELVDWQMHDLWEQGTARLRDVTHPPGKGGPEARLISPSDELAAQKRQLHAFLHERVYRHPQLLRIRARAQEELRAKFRRLCDAPEQLPEEFQRRCQGIGAPRAVGDYLACLTDQSALGKIAHDPAAVFRTL